ncbi:MAG: flagellar hook-basal body complex protein FliE [Planctomycetota bacterium]
MSGQLPLDPTRSLTGIAPTTARESRKSSEPGEGPSFAELLKNGLKEVNQLQKDAEVAIQDLSTGKRDSVTEVMTAVEKADLAFRALMQIRNKLVTAYEEINRLRV